MEADQHVNKRERSFLYMSMRDRRRVTRGESSATADMYKGQVKTSEVLDDFTMRIREAPKLR